MTWMTKTQSESTDHESSCASKVFVKIFAFDIALHFCNNTNLCVKHPMLKLFSSLERSNKQWLAALAWSQRNDIGASDRLCTVCLCGWTREHAAPPIAAPVRDGVALLLHSLPPGARESLLIQKQWLLCSIHAPLRAESSKYGLFYLNDFRREMISENCSSNSLTDHRLGTALHSERALLSPIQFPVL